MNRFLTAAVTIAALTFGMSANAASFHGSFWDGDPATLNSIDQAITFAGTKAPDATFQSTEIKYGTPDSSPIWKIGTLGSFLGTDANSVVGVPLTTSFLGSVLKLTGFSNLIKDQDITVTSDDGFRLLIDDLLFSEFLGLRGPTGPQATTTKKFDGPTGRYAVTLWYFEGQETQARLASNLTPSAVPLPAGGLLLLTALVGGGLAARRRRA